MTIDGGLVFEAGLAPYNLKPIVEEFYGSKDGIFSLGTQVWWDTEAIRGGRNFVNIIVAGNKVARTLWLEGGCH